MNREKLIRIKNFFINIGVFLTILIGVESILIGYNRQFKILTELSNYSGFISSRTLHLHRSMSVILGFGLIFISYRLFKRMKMAWGITTVMLSLLMLMHIVRAGSLLRPTILIELFVLIILVLNRDTFCKDSDPISLKNGIWLSLAVVGIILFNIVIAMLVLKFKTTDENELSDAILKTLNMLLLMDPHIMGKLSRLEILYLKSTIVINWTAAAVALAFVLKPLVYQPIVTALDKEKVRKLLLAYGDNPVSYVSLENDKKYYFGKAVEGVVAYVHSAGVAVCAGDPICSLRDMPLLITEFINYCRLNEWDICFCATMDKTLQLYTQLGFSGIKCGEDAMFELQTYELKGKPTAKLRNAINHATSLGISVIEYKPLEARDAHLEQQLRDISAEWLKSKKSSTLSFMLGSPALDNPMDRRYFAALDRDGQMLGFIVFTPFSGGQGYYADVTRRKNDAPIGVMEKITIEAFQKMKAEGVKWGSLGLAPLVNNAENGKVAGSLMDFIYENFNNFYGFKTLHHYKKKFGCTTWGPRYIVYYQKLLTPKIAYSVIKAQNPKGVWDYILTPIRTRLGKKGE